MKLAILITVLWVLSLNLFSQDSTPPNSIIETNFLIEPGEPSYGFHTGYQHKVLEPSKLFVFYLGAYESFLRTNENVDDEGTAGQTIANGLGGMLTGELRFFKNRNVFYNASIHSGWGYRKTSVNLNYPYYNINSDYEEDYHFMMLGVDMRAGYRWKNKWGVQFIARYDFSRIADQYRNVLGEKPGFIYGFGITYNWIK